MSQAYDMAMPAAAPAAEPEMARAVAEEYGYAEADVMYNESAAYPGGDYKTANFISDSPVPSKIIQTANIESQTDRFDEVTGQLRAAAPEMGGYVEYADMQTVYYDGRNNWRTFNITLRVPADKFDETRLLVESIAKVISSNQNAEDVSARYYDLAGRLETKLIEEERVLEMITQARRIDDMLALEERLGEIRTSIELYRSQMTSIDRLAAFSTIYVSLREVTKEELVIVSDNLGGRIRTAFVNSVNNTVTFMQDAVIFFAGLLIPLVMIGLPLMIVTVILLIVFRKKGTA
jgi:uncharacterized protein (DUF849 family)